MTAYNKIRKVLEDGTGSRSPLKNVGDVGRPPHLNFSRLNYRVSVSNGTLLYITQKKCTQQ